MNFSLPASLKAQWMASPYYVLYGTAAHKIRSMASAGRWKAWICSGREQTSGLEFRFAYAGSKQNKNYMMRMFLGEDAEERSLGALNSEDISQRAKDSGCQLMVYEVRENDPRPLEGKTHFKIPIWTPQRLDIQGDIALLYKRESLGPMRKRFRKNALEFEFTQDEKKLREYYVNLHAPFTTSKHGKETFLHPYHEMLARSREGELLLAFKQGRCVGGNLIEYSPKEARLSFLGVKTELIQDGVVSAMLFREFLRVKEKNLDIVNLGDSRGFLRDGSFRFKAGLGCFISPHEKKPTENFWALQFLDPGPALDNAMKAHPFISLDEEGSPWGIFFTEEAIPETLCEGLTGVRTYENTSLRLPKIYKPLPPS